MHLATTVALLAAGSHARYVRPNSLDSRADKSDIKTLVAFGDSYAAGMGTGTTTTLGCRVGSNNYGKLLQTWFKIPDNGFESHVCSGHTIGELDKQINAWKNYKNADVATLSIGGNDLDFGAMVKNCFLTPGSSVHWSGSDMKEWEKSCNEDKKKANDKMDDGGGSGYVASLKNAYKKILGKAGKDDFHLYVTSYAEFFNADTTWCNDVTFSYFAAGHHDSKQKNENNYFYLKQDYRRDFNKLLLKANGKIKEAVDAANHEHGSEKVHFVDVNSRFAGHRFCEQNIKETDQNNPENFFFLSAWKDIGPAGSSIAGDPDAQERAAMAAAKKITLPNPKTCSPEQQPGADPWEAWSCTMAMAVAKAPDGEVAKSLKAANEALAKGDVNAKEISWWLPTSTVKTFHPRTRGMYVYRDAVVDAIKGVQSDSTQKTKFCLPAGMFHNKPLSSEDVDAAADAVCAKAAGKKMHNADTSVELHWPDKDHSKLKGPPLVAGVKFLDGCVYAKEQTAANKETCVGNIKDAFKCDNKGTGGFVRDSCITYFMEPVAPVKPSKSQPAEPPKTTASAKPAKPTTVSPPKPTNDGGGGGGFPPIQHPPPGAGPKIN